MSNQIQPNPYLPIDEKVSSLKTRLIDLIREIANKHNASYFWETSGTAAPTTGTWGQGDKCKNTAPVELGAATAKYVIVGYICTASGTPGTWLEMRSATGN